MLTREELIHLATKAGYCPKSETLPSSFEGFLGRFATLVADREREACLAEIETGIWLDKTTEEVLAEIAAAIHARGKGGGTPC